MAQALGTIHPVLDTFDNTNNVYSPSKLHQEANSKKDFRNTLDISAINTTSLETMLLISPILERVLLNVSPLQ